ncbi:hypothetical protein AUJ17_01735 [Candidatus Micrarchaeota archaeon CG1_02_47_40]|nr:MAG: hypothetical protein AUJ17_01735 [Candidatus Micrarchaeota archaeon CG1_02_47_40]
MNEGAEGLEGVGGRELLKDMETAAQALCKARKDGASVLIRYHNDADGICSALCICEALEPLQCISFPSDSATYQMEDAHIDVNLLSRGKNSLAIMLDFGVNEESLEALKEIKKTGAKLIIIDHHPYCEKVKEIADVFVSPLSHSLESKYAAGFLCAKIAKIAGVGEGVEKYPKIALADEKERLLENYARIALAGDRSSLAPIEEDAKKAALVLEYAATYEKFPKKLEFYKKLLEEGELFSSIYASAREKFEEIVEAAKNCTRRVERKEMAFHYVNMDKLMKMRHFPSKARALTQVFDALCEEEGMVQRGKKNEAAAGEREKGNAVVVIGFGESLVTFRANQEAIKKGFDAGKIIERIKEEIKTGINLGGGHAAAASIRTKKGFAKIVLLEVEKAL